MRGLSWIAVGRPALGRPALSRPSPGRRGWALRIRRPDERGAVAVLVAVLMGLGVFTGVAALVVDVGQMYAEREQLQSGADAAALAIAQGCVKNPGTCGSQTRNGMSTQQWYADNNAADGKSKVDVCGYAQGLTPCPADPAGANARCIGSAPVDRNGSALQYVEVRTRTQMRDDTLVLPPTFAGTLTGYGAGRGISACARVKWGLTSKAWSKSVMVSSCEFQAMAARGPGLYDLSDPTQNPRDYEVRFFHNSSTRTGSVAACPGGSTLSGFDWMPTSSGDPCHLVATVGSTYLPRAVDVAEDGCDRGVSDTVNLNRGRLGGLVLFFGVYDSYSAATGYHIQRLVGFIPTAMYLPTASHVPHAAPIFTDRPDPCPPTIGEACIAGIFTSAVSTEPGATLIAVPYTDPGGGVLIKLAG